MISGARDELRRKTAPAHRSLDDCLLIRQLVKGKLPDRKYAELLVAYLGWFEPWEASVCNHHPDLVNQLGEFRFQKSRWLREDLRVLGVEVAPASANGGGERDPVRLAGQVYVVEGSTLGGTHLFRSGMLPAGACRFYRGYGERTREAWMKFLPWLEASLPDRRSRDEAAHAATRVFADLISAFDRIRPGD